MEHDMCAVEQLQLVGAQPHLNFKTDSGTGEILAGRATGSSLLV